MWFINWTTAVIKRKEAYVRLFADYGWEYLQDVNGFSYFRKPSAQFEEERQKNSSMIGSLSWQW